MQNKKRTEHIARKCILGIQIKDDAIFGDADMQLIHKAWIEDIGSWMHPEEAKKYREMMEAAEGGRKGKEKGNEKGQTKGKNKSKEKGQTKGKSDGKEKGKGKGETRTKSTPGSSVCILRILVPDLWEQAHGACHDQMPLHLCCTAASLHR